MISQIAIDFGALATPPNATFAIIGIALALGAATSIIGVRSMDLDAYRKLTIESSKIRKELMDATRSGNQRRMAKAQKRQQDLMAQQSKISMDRMKSSLFFTIPLLFMWRPMSEFFSDTVIAYFPLSFPWVPMEFKFIHWYILCSISFNIVLNRLFGLSFEIDPED
jgi:uncharacterized membrane protein (DUF106 family)